MFPYNIKQQATEEIYLYNYDPIPTNFNSREQMN